MKPILCFFVGYTPDYTGPETDAYGSELALKRMSELLASHYRVYIFGTSFLHKVINRVVFMHSSYLKDFSRMNKIDVMIISRYVYYFLENTISARKTYVWLHDTLLLPYWNGVPLPDGGKLLLENIFPLIDGIITLCDWHKLNVLHNFNIDSSKVFIIGNGIDLEKFNQSTIPPEKVKNRFIYMSCPNRGLLRLVSHFHKIREHLPDAELHIYRGIDPSNRLVLDELEKYPYIKYMGKVPNQQLIPEILKAEYWYYPTDFFETYCISALEALMSGCICITSNIGALTNTIEDRGILIDKSPYSDEYQKEALDVILNLNEDSNLKLSYIEKSQEWARKQTWENRLPEWLNLLL